MYNANLIKQSQQYGKSVWGILRFEPGVIRRIKTIPDTGKLPEKITILDNRIKLDVQILSKTNIIHTIPKIKSNNKNMSYGF